MKIRNYSLLDEKEWVYTKALSYLFSPFFDDIDTTKTQFDPNFYTDKIELVATIDNKIVGLLDIGIYQPDISKTYLYYQADCIAYFENLTVHPDFQRQGIAGKLFKEAKKLLIKKDVDVLAIFTRESDSTNELYQKWGAELVCQDYLLVGTPKNLESCQYLLDKENKKLKLVGHTSNTVITSILREGHYLVTDEADLEKFNIDLLIKEFSYILKLK